MASTDALPIPRKNVAYRVYFPIMKSDGTVITGWAGAAATRSLDGATSGAVTNTPTEIASSWGIGYLDLTQAEMNVDALMIKVTVTNTGAVTQVLVLYPQEDVDIRANLVDVAGAALASAASGYLPADAIKWTGGTIPAPNVTGEPLADTNHWRGTQPNTLQSGRVDGYVGAMASGVIAAATFAANALDAVWSTTTRALTDKVGFALSSGGIQAIWDALTSALTTANSIGKRLADNVDATISSRSTVATIWDTLLTSVLTLGSVGKLIKDNLDAAITSRSTYAGADTSGTTTLLSRLTAGRAGYLDNLNVGGLVASNADILALNQSASRRVMLVSLQQFERPSTSSVDYTLELRTYDGDGAAVAADSTPTLAATGSISGSLSGNLTGPTAVATGVYRWTYNVDNADAVEQVIFDASATLSASTFTISTIAQVVDYVSATPWTDADRTLLNDIHGKLPSRDYLAGSTLSTGDISADVVSGLDTQGYSATRAGYLDTLNGLIAAIWANASRTLTAFGFGVTVTTNNDKTGYALAVTPPTAVQVRQEIDSNSTQLALLLARLTNTRAGLLDNLSRLDVATSELLTTSDYTAPDNAGINTLLTRISAARALLLDNLTLVDIAISTRLAAAGYTVPPTTGSISQAIIDKVVPNGQPTNSVGKLLRTAGSATDPLTNLVPGVYEEGSGGYALGLLSAGRLTILSPLDAITGDLELVRGDDYDALYHPIPPWTSSAWASYNLDDGTTTVAFKALATGGTLFTTPCVIQSATSIYVELTHTQTSAFPAGTYSMRYELEATLTSGEVITLARGRLSILEDLR